MTQIDPRRPTTTPNPNPGEPQRKQEPSFNWRVSVGMATGLLVLFGVLFGLRALDIFPPKPAEDPQIAAVRATLSALPTQQPAPAVQPTPASTQAPAPATLGAIALSTPAATGAAPAAATVASAPTTAPTPAAALQSSTQTQTVLATGTQFDTAPTPVATTSALGIPTVATGNTAPSAPETSPTTVANSASAQPTPVAINLPADLANAILQGYSNYWTVRVNAMRDPQDASIDLGSVMAESELAGAQKTLAQYRDAGEAFQSDVKHTIWITDATPDEAVVVDRYVGNTVFLDPSTKEPLGSQPVVQSFSDRFLLKKIEGTWKVVQEEPEQ
jgi:hypothetical protein